MALQMLKLNGLFFIRLKDVALKQHPVNPPSLQHHHVAVDDLVIFRLLGHHVHHDDLDLFLFLCLRLPVFVAMAAAAWMR
jgi:hypothetical protein